MISDTIALTARALKKWVRNPAAILPGFFTAIFYLALFGNSFNPTNLIPSQLGGTPIPAALLQEIRSMILGQTFGGAATYITYLTAGVICLIIVFNMAFGGIDLVLDRQLGFLNALLTAPISRASIYFSGTLQNLVKAMALALLSFLVALVVPDGLRLQPSFGILQFLGIFAAFALLAFGLSCIFTVLALSVRSIDSLIAIVNFVTFPLLFTSDALFPSSSFPAWLRTVANVNPISKADEVARLLIVNGHLSSSQFWTVTSDLTYLVVFVLILAVLGYMVARRALRAE